MSKFSRVQILTISILSSFFLLGCGSNTDNTTSTMQDTRISGQLIDTYVKNIDYVCNDGSNGVTDINGRFNCISLPVEFKIGSLKLGLVSTLAEDKQVFPQDLFNLSRDDNTSLEVIAMARFLQSCDEDNNTQNGITIAQSLKEKFTVSEDFSADKIDTYANITIDEAQAIQHLSNTIEFVNLVNSASTLPIAVKDALLTVNSTLTQEAKNTLSYMGNEERLAYDIYMKLYESYPLTQFTNIANNGEKVHIQAVQLLIQKYINSYDEFTNIDLTELKYMDASIEDMSSGVYDISAIQNLYDLLLSKGQQSQQDALEVGCMVEVTDINDLLHDIEIAKESDANDIVTTFEFLRDGSYAHYWAFDKGLVAMGVTEGCCVLGAEYCHPEYPQNQNGSTNGSSNEDTTGQQKGKH